MITDIAQSLIDDVKAYAPDMSLEEAYVLRNLTDEIVTTLKDAAKASFKQRFAEERERLEACLLAEAEALGIDLTGENKARQKAPPVYQNPENLTQTWSGKGKRPKWFTDAIEKGVTMDSMRIPITTTETPF